MAEGKWNTEPIVDIDFWSIEMNIWQICQMFMKKVSSQQILVYYVHH